MTELGILLDEAKETITKKRQDSYGNPEDCFQCIADFWEVFDRHKGGHITSAQEVAYKQILLKLARALIAPKRDNLLDVCGYASIIEDKLTKGG